VRAADIVLTAEDLAEIDAEPGQGFVGTRRYAILFTRAAQPPIVTK
jgi:hypothetical protein